MTSTAPETPPTDPRAPLRELLGLVLILVGAIALTVIAFTVDWRLGVTLLAAAAVAVGGFMAFGEA